MKRGNRIITVICYIALVLVLVGVVGFILKLTNGGTDTFKFFYVTNEKGDVYATTDNAKLASAKQIRLNVNYTFSDNGKGYTVKVVSNAEKATSFEYTIDGETKEYSPHLDFTSVFKVTPYDDYFTLEMPTDMQTAMQALYPDKVVEVPDGIDLMTKPYFLLQVTSYNGQDEITLRLTQAAVSVEDIILDYDNLVF